MLSYQKVPAAAQSRAHHGHGSPRAPGAYDAHYRRLFDFYTAGRANATDPFEVAALVHEAVTTDDPRLRYACSWGGPELIAGRRQLSDEDWVALGAVTDDDEYRKRFQEAFEEVHRRTNALARELAKAEADKVVSRKASKATRRASDAISDADWQKRLNKLKGRWNPGR